MSFFLVFCFVVDVAVGCARYELFGFVDINTFACAPTSLSMRSRATFRVSELGVVQKYRHLTEWVEGHACSMPKQEVGSTYLDALLAWRNGWVRQENRGFRVT